MPDDDTIGHSQLAQRVMNRILYGKPEGILGFVSKHRSKKITGNF